jgi:TATA-box binding protein (TBP) (component of TFIID and TFIIIB)
MSQREVQKQTTVLGSIMCALAYKAEEYKRVNCVVTTTLMRGNGPLFGDMDAPGMSAMANLLISKRFQGLFSANTNAVEYPRCTVELFSSGCLLILGTKGKPAAILAGILYTRTLSEMMGCVITWTPFVAHNEVTCCHLERKLDVGALVYTHPLITSYQPEVYPALYVRIEGEPVFTIYCRSGQVIITGARSKEDAITAMERLKLLLEPFMYDE